MIEVSDQKPPNFSADMEAAACYLEVEGRLLLLQQAAGRREEGAWGVPAGKFEGEEEAEAAARRELFEETGIQVQELALLGVLYVRKPSISYVYHAFRVLLDQRPPIHLSYEHADYRWCSLKDLENLPLRVGAKEALQYYRSWLNR